MIQTERCTMTRFNNEHRDFYHELVSDESVRKYLGGIPSEDHIEKSINRFIHDPSGAFWVVCENASNHYIGFISMNIPKCLINMKSPMSFYPIGGERGMPQKQFVTLSTMHLIR